MVKIYTNADIGKLNVGDVVFDADGDWMVKGTDGYMHQLSEQPDPSPCYLPAQVMIPETNQPTIVINVTPGKCRYCGG